MSIAVSELQRLVAVAVYQRNWGEAASHAAALTECLQRMVPDMLGSEVQADVDRDPSLPEDASSPTCSTELTDDDDVVLFEQESVQRKWIVIEESNGRGAMMRSKKYDYRLIEK